MKKISLFMFIIVSVLAAVALFNLLESCDNVELYAETAKIVNIDRDIITLETFTGNMFTFEGAEDWQVGDCVSLIMDSRETERIDDDEILRVCYSGWELKREV